MSYELIQKFLTFKEEKKEYEFCLYNWS